MFYMNAVKSLFQLPYFSTHKASLFISNCISHNFIAHQCAHFSGCLLQSPFEWEYRLKTENVIHSLNPLFFDELTDLSTVFIFIKLKVWIQSQILPTLPTPSFIRRPDHRAWLRRNNCEPLSRLKLQARHTQKLCSALPMWLQLQLYRVSITKLRSRFSPDGFLEKSDFCTLFFSCYYVMFDSLCVNTTMNSPPMCSTELCATTPAEKGQGKSCLSKQLKRLERLAERSRVQEYQLGKHS